jgi:hypothetical protein
MVRHVPLHQIDTSGRFRKDLGDLDELAASMAEIGLLQPIGLTPSLRLVFGGRRLEAARLLHWETIPAFVLDRLVDAVAALKAEQDENRCRKEMTPTELVALGRAIEAVEREAAATRMKAGKGACGQLPQGDEGKTRDRVGDALGVSGRTYEKARQVVEAAEEDPEVFGDLPDLMDGRSVDAAHRAFRERAAALADAQTSLPRGEESGSLSPPGREETGPHQEVDEMAAWTPSERERRDLVKEGQTVVANLKRDARLIAWAERNGLYVRIDRTTTWGNPFVLGEDGDRPTVLKKYARYFAMKNGLKKRLPQLRGKVLGCWCHPEPCHGNHLIKLAESAP